MRIAIIIFAAIVGFVVWCFLRAAKRADEDIKKILDLRTNDDSFDNY